MVRGDLMSWFVVVQYLPDNLIRCCLSEVSAATDVVVHGCLILLCHLVLNLIKTSAASSNKFKNKFCLPIWLSGCL